MLKLSFKLTFWLMFANTLFSQEVDIRGIKIGQQIWMADNISLENGNSVCYANKEQNCENYGMLYAWDDAMSVCPQGWHLPSDKEWDILSTTLKGDDVAGEKLKEKGPTNFSVKFGGLQNEEGVFKHIDKYAAFWTSTSTTEGFAYDRYISRSNTHITKNDKKNQLCKLSVRCIKDQKE